MLDIANTEIRGDVLQVDPNCYLLVCLCDMNAQDAVFFHNAMGNVNLCKDHKAAKLESLASSVKCAVRFAHIEPNGDFSALTLQEALNISATS